MDYIRDSRVYNVVYSLYCFLFQLDPWLVDTLQSPPQVSTKLSPIFSIS